MFWISYFPYCIMETGEPQLTDLHNITEISRYIFIYKPNFHVEHSGYVRREKRIWTDDTSRSAFLLTTAFGKKKKKSNQIKTYHILSHFYYIPWTSMLGNWLVKPVLHFYVIMLSSWTGWLESTRAT